MERLSLNETTAAQRERAAALVCNTLPRESYYELDRRGLLSDAMNAAMQGGEFGLQVFLLDHGIRAS